MMGHHGSASVAATGPRARPDPSRYLIIVSRERPELCTLLRQLLPMEDVEIRLDRRHQSSGAPRCERRDSVRPQNDLRARHYLVVRSGWRQNGWLSGETERDGGADRSL